MEDRIRNLDDTSALSLLSMMVRPHLRNSALVTEPAPELRQALAEQFGPYADLPPSEGELARQALLLLAQTPDTAGPLAAFLDGPSAERFSIDPTQSVVVITAALVVLQMHVRVERTTSGKWKLLMEKKASTAAFLKSFVDQLLTLFPSSKS